MESAFHPFAERTFFLTDDAGKVNPDGLLLLGDCDLNGGSEFWRALRSDALV